MGPLWIDCDSFLSATSGALAAWSDYYRRWWPSSTRHSENDKTPQPIDQRMSNPLLGPELVNYNKFASVHYLAHGQAYMGQMDEILQHCTTTCQDNFTDLRPVKIHPADYDICILTQGKPIWGKWVMLQNYRFRQFHRTLKDHNYRSRQFQKKSNGDNLAVRQFQRYSFRKLWTPLVPGLSLAHGRAHMGQMGNDYDVAQLKRKSKR